MDGLERMVTLSGDVEVLALCASTDPFEAVFFELRLSLTHCMDSLDHGTSPWVPELVSSFHDTLLLFLS